MKRVVYFVLLLCFVACQNSKKEDKVQKIVPESSERLDSLKYTLQDQNWANDVGLYFSYNSSAFINICEYQRLTKAIKPSDEQINFFLTNNLIPSEEYSCDYSGKCDILKKIDYSRKMWVDSSNVVYYEIVDVSSSYKRTKTIGKLYKFYEYGGSLGGGNIYLSDTTNKYGWFIIQTPIHLKPPTHFTKPVLEKLKITSLNKKAESLCGEYDKLANYPYRIIKDEEVKSRTYNKNNL
jgi:hypothetical protein